MASENELFANVDALLEEEPQLPPPVERARLREAAGITQARMAKALGVTEQTVKNWENGRSEPKSPRLEAYQRLLNGWAAKYPAHGAPAAAPTPVPVIAPRSEAPQTFNGPAEGGPQSAAAVEVPAGWNGADPPVTRRAAAS
ncbi:MAG: helix-turn-helix transcriptional regulator, partial [Streptomyces sp.]|nr:helix-turn-helix transcriptional regulator [Streptomyces sp.]